MLMSAYNLSPVNQPIRQTRENRLTVKQRDRQTERQLGRQSVLVCAPLAFQIAWPLQVVSLLPHKMTHLMHIWLVDTFDCTCRRTSLLPHSSPHHSSAASSFASPFLSPPSTRQRLGVRVRTNAVDRHIACHTRIVSWMNTANIWYGRQVRVLVFISVHSLFFLCDICGQHLSVCAKRFSLVTACWFWKRQRNSATCDRSRRVSLSLYLYMCVYRYLCIIESARLWSNATLA